MRRVSHAITVPGRRRLLSACAALATCWWTVSTASGRDKLLRFEVTISNPTAVPVVDRDAWMYVPMQRTAMQRLLDVRVSSPEHRLVSDDAGQVYIALRIERLAPLGSMVVSVSARVGIDEVAAPEPLTSPSSWLGTQRLIEMHDDAIRTRAAALRREDHASTVRAIYDWVRSNMSYAGYVADDRGAAEAMRSLRGDCTEYAYLCAAMARANGIPARVVGGFVVESSAAPRAREFHDWAQCHLQGAWRTVDAQRERWWDVGEYVAFSLRQSTAGLNPLGNAPRFMVGEPLRMTL